MFFHFRKQNRKLLALKGICIRIKNYLKDKKKKKKKDYYQFRKTNSKKEINIQNSNRTSSQKSIQRDRRN